MYAIVFLYCHIDIIFPRNVQCTHTTDNENHIRSHHKSCFPLLWHSWMCNWGEITNFTEIISDIYCHKLNWSAFHHAFLCFKVFLIHLGRWIYQIILSQSSTCVNTTCRFFSLSHSLNNHYSNGGIDLTKDKTLEMLHDIEPRRMYTFLNEKWLFLRIINAIFLELEKNLRQHKEILAIWDGIDLIQIAIITIW